MRSLFDLISQEDSATAVFFGSVIVLIVVSLLVLHPPANYKPRLVSPPVSVSPGLVQEPQLLREGSSADAQPVFVHQNG